MLTTKRKPASVGEILTEEFMEPLGLTQAALAQAMGVPLEHADELCDGRRFPYRPHEIVSGTCPRRPSEHISPASRHH